MASKADVVVIGGGIIGSSVAYFLAKSGMSNIVLVEKSEVASGATRHSAANVRQHYSNEVAIRLVLRGLEIFSNSDRELGGPTGFTRTGYLVLANDEQQAGIRQNVALQQRLGVETRLLTRQEACHLFPQLDLADIALAAHEPRSGYADPVMTVRTIVSSARALGVEIREHCEVLGIATRDGKVKSVHTSAGEIVTTRLVNAAGPWANRIAAMVGGEYSLRLSREEEAVFSLPIDTATLPIVSDAPGHLYVRPHGAGRLLAGFGYPKELQPCDPDNFVAEADADSVERLAAMVSRRVPMASEYLAGYSLPQATFGRYAGVYSITDDWYPIVGESHWAKGFFEAVGGSGHSFKLGPPIGEALASVIVGQTPNVDISSLGHSRFDRGRVFASVWGAGNRG